MLLKATAHQLERVLRVRNAHKGLAQLCELHNESLTNTNNALRRITSTRNTKFKRGIIDTLPKDVDRYFTLLGNYLKQYDFNVLTRDNSPRHTPYFVSVSKHYKSCLSLHLRLAPNDYLEALAKLPENDLLTFLCNNASKMDERTRPQGYTGDFILKGASNSAYLNAEYTAWSEDHVRYLVLGDLFDINNPESEGYRMRVRLIRYQPCNNGDYPSVWSINSVYGDTTVPLTTIVNYLVSQGYVIGLSDRDYDDMGITPPSTDTVMYVNRYKALYTDARKEYEMFHIIDKPLTPSLRFTTIKDCFSTRIEVNGIEFASSTTHAKPISGLHYYTRCTTQLEDGFTRTLGELNIIAKLTNSRIRVHGHQSFYSSCHATFVSSTWELVSLGETSRLEATLKHKRTGEIIYIDPQNLILRFGVDNGGSHVVCYNHTTVYSPSLWMYKSRGHILAHTKSP